MTLLRLWRSRPWRVVAVFGARWDSELPGQYHTRQEAELDAQRLQDTPGIDWGAVKLRYEVRSVEDTD